ncbi:hypothetical protein Psyaliredsea_16880 [Psychrobacter alimentarius]
MASQKELEKTNKTSIVKNALYNPDQENIQVRGARVHNLKNVDVNLPRNALVVFTGISGSGKSSLAFGTLFAESQRRYLDSVSPYARRLIDQVDEPDVDSIEGLPPAVALQQQRGTPSVRSSVGSVTTISNGLRMLYSRAGEYPANQEMLYADAFSPNTPDGACPTCSGIGRVFEVTEALLVPDNKKTIRERAIAAWPPAWQGQNLSRILTTLGYDIDKPWHTLPKKRATGFCLPMTRQPCPFILSTILSKRARRLRTGRSQIIWAPLPVPKTLFYILLLQLKARVPKNVSRSLCKSLSVQSVMAKNSKRIPVRQVCWIGYR